MLSDAFFLIGKTDEEISPARVTEHAPILTFQGILIIMLLKLNQYLASPPGGDEEEVQGLTVGTARGIMRYKVKP